MIPVIVFLRKDMIYKKLKGKQFLEHSKVVIHRSYNNLRTMIRICYDAC